MLPLLGSGQALAQAQHRPPAAHLRVGGGHPIEHRHQRLGRSSSWGTVSSQNWAGYDATGGGFTSVTASWVEPSIQASYSPETYAVFWVGLDGDGSPTVEQIGTAAYSEGGSVYYFAWYEMYPAAAILIPVINVSPGDEMTGTVTSDGAGGFTLKLVNDTTNEPFSIDKTSISAQRFSAEVIAEAPSSSASGPTFQLANFGSVDFTNCAFDDQPINAFAYNQIDMVSADNVTEATTSALGSDGASFSVTTPPVTIASGYDGAWHNSAVQVTLTATDYAGGSGVKSITYSVDGGMPTTVDAAATQVTIGAPADHSNDGVHTLSFYSTDNDGNQETAKSVTVKIDTTPAVTIASGYDGAWQNSAVPVTLTATDNASGSGVKSITYSIDGGAPATVDAAATQVTIGAPADHSNDGVHTLSFYSADNGGNQETAKSVTVEIDTTPPVVSASGAGNGAWLNHAAAISLSATDSGSGLVSIGYTLDGVAHTAAGASTQVVLPARPNATHTLTYHATDLTGNVSADYSLGVHIDTLGPVTAAKPARGRKGKAITLRCRVRDNLSPRATSVTLTIRNSHKKVVKTLELGTEKISAWHAVKWTPKAKGMYSYTVTARDLAGNKQAKAGSAKITVE
ncbi:MAG: G1 family glutamic endopeptidase [Gaiellaceae bacterium]